MHILGKMSTQKRHAREVRHDLEPYRSFEALSVKETLARYDCSLQPTAEAARCMLGKLDKGASSSDPLKRGLRK